MPHGVSCRAFGAFNFRRSGRPEHSEKAHREVVLFLAQRELESAFQRLVNMEMYEEARQIASQQEKLQEIVEGETSAGLDSASSSDDTSAEGNANDKLNDGEVVVKLLSLRTDLQRAIDNEDYARASVVRDEILEIEDAMQKQKSSKPPVKKNKPKYNLGQCVVHFFHGWTGVICGMQQDEIEVKKKDADRGTSEVVKEVVYKYHILPDVKYWPKQTARDQLGGLFDSAAGQNIHPCVALVEESELNAPTPPATWRSVRGQDPNDPDFLISHPYMYLMFYGQDGEGNYVPSKKLREKFKRQRRDAYWSDGKDSDHEDDDDDDDGNTN